MTRVIAIALFVVADVARAQPPEPAQADEARALFDQAVEELRRGEFPTARDHLRRSLDLFATAGTAFNLALALNGTGETVEAVHVLEQLEAGAFGALSAEETEQVRGLLERARADLARLRVTVRGPPRARVRVDGEPAGEATRGRALEVTLDAGRHVVGASAPEHESADAAVDLARGEDRALTLSLAPLPAPPPPEETSTLWESPLTWIVLGVVVAGGVVAAVLLTRDRTADPVRDPDFGLAAALSF